LLEKCLKSQYGRAVTGKLPEGFEIGKVHRLHICLPGAPVPGDVPEDAREMKIGDGKDRASLYFNESAGEAEAVFEGTDFQEDARLFFSAIVTFVQLVLRRRRLYVFHASAVSLKGAGVLIGGDNGSGKSTLMRRLLETGADYLADDAAVVDMDGKPCVIRRSPEILNVLDLSPSMREMLLEKGFRKTDGGVFMAPPAKPLAAPVRTVLFPSIVKGKLSVVSLTNREVFLKLLELRRTPLTQKVLGEFFGLCAEMAEGVKAACVKIPRGRIPAPGELAEICENL